MTSKSSNSKKSTPAPSIARLSTVVICACAALASCAATSTRSVTKGKPWASLEITVNGKLREFKMTDTEHAKTCPLPELGRMIRAAEMVFDWERASLLRHILECRQCGVKLEE